MIDLTPTNIAQSLGVRRRARAWSLGLSAYAAVAALGLGGVILGTPRTQDLRAKVARVEMDVDTARKDLAQVSGEMTRLQRELDAARAVGEHPDWSIVLSLVAKAQRGRQVMLEHVSLAPVLTKAAPAAPGKRKRQEVKEQDPPVPIGYEVLLSGLAKTELDASRFALGLEKVGAFDRVTLVSTRAREVDDASYTAFEIRVELRETAHTKETP